MNVRILLVCILFLSSNLAQSQELGLPFIQNFTLTDYNAGSQNWDITQDDNGIVYVANNDGVLQYDGISWRLIQTSNQSTVRSLAYHNGRVYVGAEGEIGYLEPTPNGDLQYRTLLDKLDSEYHDFNIAWKVLVADGEIYFRTSKYLIRWNGTKMKVWKSKYRFLKSYVLNDKFYVNLGKADLYVVNGDSLQLAFPNRTVKTDRVWALLPYNEQKAISITKNLGLGLLDLADGSFEKIESPDLDNFMGGMQIYNSCKLANGNVVLATLGGGIGVFDQNWNLIQSLGKLNGLQDDVAINVFETRDGQLWGALNTGIDKIEINSPFRVFDERQGLPNSIINSEVFYGQQVVGTAQGVLKLGDEKFEKIGELIDQSWDLQLVPQGEDTVLLVAEYNGLFSIDKNYSVSRLPAKRTVLCLHLKNKRNDIVFAGGISGLEIYRFINNEWELLSKVDGLKEEVESIVEDKAGNIWVSTNSQKIAKITFEPFNFSKKPEIQVFDDTKGVPQSNFTKLFFANGEVLAGTKTGLLKYDESSGSFVPYTGFGDAFADGESQVFNLIKQQNTEEFWVGGLSNKDLVGKVDLGEGKSPKLEFGNLFRRLPKGETSSLMYDDGSLWLSSTKLYQFDEAKARRNAKSKSFSAQIRKVYVNTDSTLFWGNNSQQLQKEETEIADKQKGKTVLEYEYNSIVFEYVGVNFTLNSQTKYSYFLDGHDKKWSPWVSDIKKEYTDLFEGEYTFKVKAKNVYGEESVEDSFQFSIQAPFYRTIWAYLFYALLFIVLIAGLMKLNSKRHKAEKRRLESIVQKRTAEISNKNEEIAMQNAALEQQKAIIEKKNKKTQDSIVYAERILSALHTSPNKMTACLPDSFVFSQPRDIVSGDFFWCGEKDGKFIIACVDCTGHGIPGAFMSVIGQSLIKETIQMLNIIEPDEILTSLHSMMVASLEHKKGESIEGMDMGVCVIDFEKKEVAFSGAKNPLVYVQNNELKIIKGNKMPVGGIRPDEEREFEKHVISFENNPTTFYLYSDGFQDQFGGEKGRKYLATRFRELLFSIHQKPIEAQREYLDSELNNWKINTDQIDDVLVVGFKV
jgi:serine phosphatase RsbU (regulator of sigma subunit)/ligand-binding sensor domain-containing protein